MSPQLFWQNKHHEIDFVSNNNQFIEVKRGNSYALEFGWFIKQFPQKQLTVINQQTFATASVKGQTFASYLKACS